MFKSELKESGEIDEILVRGAERARAIAKENIAKVIVGHRRTIRETLTALLAGGHVLLEGVPGIGKKSALMILLEIMRYPNANAKEMTALMGLDPVLKDSGVFRGKSRISKQGGKHLREKLYLPTVVAIQHNDRLKIFYERLVGNGKPKKLALLAAMRKLLVIALGVIRKREPYRALG